MRLQCGSRQSTTSTKSHILLHFFKNNSVGLLDSLLPLFIFSTTGIFPQNFVISCICSCSSAVLGVQGEGAVCCPVCIVTMSMLAAAPQTAVQHLHSHTCNMRKLQKLTKDVSHTYFSTPKCGWADWGGPLTSPACHHQAVLSRNLSLTPMDDFYRLRNTQTQR